jgi:hypothetical protein
MKNFNKEYEHVLEGFGFHKTVTRERYPSKLNLSEDFIRAFKEEFEKQTSPIYTEDESGEAVTHEARKPGVVLKEFQKALKFLI